MNKRFKKQNVAMLIEDFVNEPSDSVEAICKRNRISAKVGSKLIEKILFPTHKIILPVIITLPSRV